MEIKVLISALNKNITDISSNTRKYENLTIINQIPNKLNSDFDISKKDNVEWINIDQKGLSKSRNYAINIASVTNADVIYLTDDDIVIDKKFKEIVSQSFKENPNYDILAFNIQGIEKEFKKEVTQEMEIGYLRSMKLSSVQIVIKLDFILKNKLKFDELFGAGAKYQMGEENIFVFDALKKGAKVKFIPKTIAQLHMGNSTWFKGFTKEYFFDRGAIFSRMFNGFAPLYSFVFCFRKHKLYSKNMSLFKAYYQTLKGMRDYKRNLNI